jgi:excisionase family DNA binding protein
MPRTIGSIVLYSVDELNERLGVSKLTLRTYFRTGKLKGRKLGVSWYITEEALREFFAEEGSEHGGAEAGRKAGGAAVKKAVSQGGHGAASKTGRQRARSGKEMNRIRSLRYVIQGLNDLVSEQEECSSVEEAIECIREQAIISLFEVVVIDPETGVQLERVRAREFLERYGEA